MQTDHLDLATRRKLFCGSFQTRQVSWPKQPFNRFHPPDHMRLLTLLTLFLLLLSGLLFSGCEDKNCNCYCSSFDAQELILNDTVELKYSELDCNPEYEFRLSFDSLSDSRCPLEAVCVWEGNAEVRLIVQSSEYGSNTFRLNTNETFLTDTMVNGFRYELIDVLPYPEVDQDYELDDYTLQLIISR